MAPTTIKQCLDHIQISITSLESCSSLDEEFKLIKKAYFQKILKVHPDKGGDAGEFRAVNTAWETIRVIFEKSSISSFAKSASKNASTRAYPDSGTFKSWQFYYDAQEEQVPIYKVELAKSSRSKCAKKCHDQIIDKNEIRIGSIDLESGTYGRWIHLKCWRVPSKIWSGVPNPDENQDPAQFSAALASLNELLFTGFIDLSEKDKNLLIIHVMNRANWAKLIHRKKTDVPKYESRMRDIGYKIAHIGDAHMPIPTLAEFQHFELSQQFEMVARFQKQPSTTLSNRKKFHTPVAGKNGAIPQFLQGKTVVCTGLFPELGGGSGLNLGKDKLKKMIQDFGGRVTGSVSGKTDILVVGQQPGLSKVSKARNQPRCQLMSLQDLTGSIEGKHSLEDVEPLMIDSFSHGYGGNGLAMIASSSEMDIARGLKRPQMRLETNHPLSRKRDYGQIIRLPKRPKSTRNMSLSAFENAAYNNTLDRFTVPELKEFLKEKVDYLEKRKSELIYQVMEFFG
ncbi:hypothetical protein BC833DRAFT_592187 [Globomyces pollinis-pini]|nr:hypothetical protein BC833DRAFT_592187 [Globomyces pollinis-pini]